MSPIRYGDFLFRPRLLRLFCPYYYRVTFKGECYSHGAFLPRKASPDSDVDYSQVWDFGLS
jgi:hypothetical protein